MKKVYIKYKIYQPCEPDIFWYVQSYHSSEWNVKVIAKNVWFSLVSASEYHSIILIFYSYSTRNRPCSGHVGALALP